MKTGLGLYRKYRVLYAYYNLLRFSIRKHFVGFDVANQFIQRVDKISLQLILKKNGASIGQDCDIETGLTFHNCNNYSNLSIGDNCHIGKNCFFDLRDSIKIDNNVVISMEVKVITHIDMNNSMLRKYYTSQKKSVRVESNSYIGVGTIILMGVTIKSNGFVAGGSLVASDVDSYTLVGGLPAKLIKLIDDQIKR